MLSGCGVTFPEAALPPDEPIERATRRLEDAAGLSFRELPTVEWRLPAEVLEVRERSLLHAATAPTLESVCDRLFAVEAPGTRVAGAGPVDLGGERAPSCYDPASDAVLLAEVPGTDRRSDLARTESLAWALADQHLDLARRLEREGGRGDRTEALLAFASGLVTAATLEASTAPVIAFDASAAPLRVRQARFTERLLADPDGAPAELVTDPDLTSLERFVLERILAAEGEERRRRILRLAAGTRLVLEAKDRLADGNLALLVEDPPVSTEQILHPERYLERDDPPLVVDTGPRDGLLGPGWSAAAHGVVGEYGLRRALASALPADDAADAAEGWGGDALTLYTSREGRSSGAPEQGIAWRIEFDDRFEATEAGRAFRRAMVRAFGGAFPAVADAEGGFHLAGGRVAASLRLRKSSVAVVVGGDDAHQRAALTRLLEEPVKERDVHRSGVQDAPFRWFRRLASPFFFDQPGRFDHLVRSLYGVLFRHRAYPAGGEHWFLNPSEFPLLGCLLPESVSALLFAGEGGAHRRDVALLARSFRWFEEHRSGALRFWSPLVSFTRTAESRAFGLVYGLLWEHGSGAGREVLAPRPLFSVTSELDGESEELGVLLDLVQWRSRPGVDHRLRLFPHGLLLDATASSVTPGLDVRLLRELVRLRRHEVVPDHPRFEFSLVGGWLLRLRHDDAADRVEDTLARGLLAGVCSDPRGYWVGCGRIVERSLLGFGREDGEGFVDVLWLRF